MNSALVLGETFLPGTVILGSVIAMAAVVAGVVEVVVEVAATGDSVEFHLTI